MQISPIFDLQLYTVHYEEYEHNEFERLIENWSDVSYLHNYAIQNKIIHVSRFVKHILKCVEKIEDFIDAIHTDGEQLNQFFQNLKISEEHKLLALQKGKIQKNQLRLYAIKIDYDCYLITGGAIKMSQTMQGHQDTNKELIKLSKVKSYLKQNGVFDEDSFYELIIDIS